MIDLVRVEGLGEAVGKRVRELREAGRFTQQRAAEAAGMPREVWTRIELGVYVPCLLTLARVAEAIDVSIVDLVEPVDEALRKALDAQADGVRPPAPPRPALKRRRARGKGRGEMPLSSSTPLTRIQVAVLEFLELFHGEHGFSPTMREIQERFGWNSTNWPSQILAALEAKGAIERTPNRARTIRVLRSRDPSTRTVRTDEPSDEGEQDHG